MNTFKTLPCLAAAMLAAGCADMSSGFAVGPSQTTANALRPAADPFQQALVQGYKQNAGDENFQGNYRSADRYYRKAINAAAGKTVEMEDTASWTAATGLRSKGLNGADLQQAIDLRAQLAPWIQATKQSNPQAAAMQQLKYDCWIEQMAEQQYDQAAVCTPSVQVAAAAPFVPAPQAAAVDPCKQNPDGYNQVGTLCKVSIVNFGFDRYDLMRPGQTSDSRQTAAEQSASLDQIMRQATAINPTRIDIMGRADASGPDSYNYGLSDCRAQSVVAALRARGLPASVETRIVPLGETDLIVPTGDGVRESQNRVVMVAYQTDRHAPLAARANAAPKQDTFRCGTSARHPFPPIS
jgi:OmpA-OmpF porin, OOP family